LLALLLSAPTSKYDEESFSEEEGVDHLQQKEFIDEILFGMK